MFTKEQLAKWRELDFEFDDFYNQVAEDKNEKADRNTDNKSNSLKVLKIEGPYNDINRKLNYISRKHTYFYYAYFNKKNITQDEVSKLKWSVSYDDDSSNSFYLFSGGKLKNGKVQIKLQSTNANDKFKLYAYFDKPNNNVSLEMVFKKAITFFIGGAGDKRPYGPVKQETNIIKKEISDTFQKLIQGEKNYIGYYLGYYEVFKNQLKKSVLSVIPNKDGVSIFIVGHSLGGWNGAHLAEILHDKGYKVDTLITLDPVGTGNIVALASDIYSNYPRPKGKCDYWINIRTNPEDSDNDDWIAWGGGQWVPAERNVDVFHTTKFHHREAGKMFKESIKDYLSAENILLTRIQIYLSEK